MQVTVYGLCRRRVQREQTLRKLPCLLLRHGLEGTLTQSLTAPLPRGCPGQRPADVGVFVAKVASWEVVGEDGRKRYRGSLQPLLDASRTYQLLDRLLQPAKRVSEASWIGHRYCPFGLGDTRILRLRYLSRARQARATESTRSSWSPSARPPRTVGRGYTDLRSQSAVKVVTSSVPAAREGAQDGTGVLRPDGLSLQIPVSWVSIPEAYYAS